MYGRPTLISSGCLLALACTGAPARPPVGDLHAAPPAPTSLLRLARGGGAVLAYDGRSLAPLDWSAPGMPAIAAVVGADIDQRRVITVDPKRTLVALDLAAKRVRPLGAHVAAAALGPDGTVWTIDTALALTALGRRTTVRTAAAVPALPRTLFGTLAGRLLTVDRSGRELRTVGGGQPAAEQQVANGAVASTMYGELVAVAADSGVLLYEPDRAREPRFVEVDGRARAVVFSPSGHRFYVGTETEGVAEFDRFPPSEQRGAIALPGPVSALRMDREGRWLLVRPARRDSVWVIDLQSRKAVASIATDWQPDLPTVSASGLVAVRWQTDVVMVNVGGPRPVETGRVAGGAADVWVALAWSPSKKVAAPKDSIVVQRTDSAKADSLEARIDSALATGTTPPPVQVVTDTAVDQPSGVLYLQVSSSRNPAWVNTLAEQLKQQGLKASVLSPALPDEPYRVVLGPYPTRDAADAASRTVGMPSFVITVAAPPAPR